jgi:hypothetical protein
LPKVGAGPNVSTTQKRQAAAPLALAAGGGDLVPRPLGNQFGLELRAKDNKTRSTSRPMLVAVWNCWVTSTRSDRGTEASLNPRLPT